MNASRSVRIIAQYVRSLRMDAPVRPYEVKTPGSSGLKVDCACEALPEENHWRMSFGTSVSVSSPEGAPRLEAAVAIECVCLVEGVDAQEEAEALLLRNVLPSLYGAARSLVTSLTVPSGHAAVLLPPVTTDQLIDMVLTE